MRQGILRQSPAVLLSMLALFAALGGSVYAAAKINGRSIRPKSLPGNRLKPRSVPANRLKQGVIAAALHAAPLTGREVAEGTLGQVPSAGHAQTAGHAQSADDAQTALNAVNAEDAQTINGYSAGCEPGWTLFAGLCWEASPRPEATAAVAASDCATRGGALPDPLTLAAYAKQPNVSLDEGGEWSGDIPVISGSDVYGVITVANDGEIDFTASTNAREYRCVVPLVS